MPHKTLDKVITSAAIYLAEQAENSMAHEYSISIAAEMRRLDAIEKQHGELLLALKVCQRALWQLSFKNNVIDHALGCAYAAIAETKETT
jgi:hypothetical protein